MGIEMNNDQQTGSQLFGQLFMTLAQTVIQNLNVVDLGLTPLQLMVVMAVYTHSGISMSQLASQLDVSSAQLSRTVRTVEEKGLVKREHNQDNRRVVNVHRTKVGDEFAEKQMQQVKKRLTQRLAGLTPTQHEALDRHLSASIAILAEAGIVRMSPTEFLKSIEVAPEQHGDSSIG